MGRNNINGFRKERTLFDQVFKNLECQILDEENRLFYVLQKSKNVNVELKKSNENLDKVSSMATRFKNDKIDQIIETENINYSKTLKNANETSRKELNEISGKKFSEIKFENEANMASKIGEAFLSMTKNQKNDLITNESTLSNFKKGGQNIAFGNDSDCDPIIKKQTFDETKENDDLQQISETINEIKFIPRSVLKRLSMLHRKSRSKSFRVKTSLIGNHQQTEEEIREENARAGKENSVGLIERLVQDFKSKTGENDLGNMKVFVKEIQSQVQQNYCSFSKLELEV